MIEIVTTLEFENWFSSLKDSKGKAAIAVRLDRLELGNPGDSKSVGGGIVEMRVNFGPGYRIYFTQRGAVFILVLAGGDKSSQPRDIKRAQKIAAEWKD